MMTKREPVRNDRSWSGSRVPQGGEMDTLRAWTGVWLLCGICTAFPVAAGDKDGPRWHSEDWYGERSCDPPGSRQVMKYGKLWPPYPRPAGKGQTFWHKYHHAHYWPHPYNCEDRAYVRDALQQQAGNGWEIATTLHDYHFDPETHRLNTAGDAHLRWILTQSPLQYRTAYVAKGMTQEVSQFRLSQVQQIAQEVCEGTVPPILLKQDSFLGRPAVEIDTLRRLELQSIPQPRLFVIGPASGSGSSSSPSSSQAGGSSGQSQGGGGSSPPR